jgi:hypothetical protein
LYIRLLQSYFTFQNEQQAAAHLDTDVPGHEDDHLGECGPDET